MDYLDLVDNKEDCYSTNKKIGGKIIWNIKN